MNKSELKRNVIFGFGSNFIILMLGLVVPRITIKSYGSDVNGLLGTVTQIFAYMALLEAGIGQAARNALYKPFVNRDEESVSEVASTAQKYFHRITLYYGIGVALCSLLFPFILKSNIDKISIALIFMFEGMSGVITFYFIQTPTIILSMDGRGYIGSIIDVVNRIVSYAVKIFMAYMGINIVFLELVYFLITICKVVFYTGYFKKNYSWIKFNRKENKSLLKERNSYVITEIAWTVFSSTDLIVLSMFVSTQVSSVYAVYNMVFSSLNNVLHAIYANINYVLGCTYHENIKKYERIHDGYTSLFLGMMTVLMSVAYILTIPFIKLYTEGVSDVNYIYKSLPLWFCLIRIFSWARYVSGNLTGIAGYAEQTSKVSLIEAVVNIVLSVVLVKKYGIVGVTFATVVALPLKVLYCTYIADKKVLKRSYKKTVGIWCANIVVFSFAIFIERNVAFNISNYMSFILTGIILLPIFFIFGFIMNGIANREFVSIVKTMIKKKGW